MAKQKHLKILKQGVEAWNKWREESRNIRPDLSDANLSGANLSGANLSRAILVRTNLSGANLSYTYLVGANFIRANLSYANFSPANLVRANLSYTNLQEANLCEADIRVADLSYADLTMTNMTNSIVDQTHFDAVDLSTIKGLETLNHHGPSHISIDTIIKSKGKIPEIFLRRAGVPDFIIKQIPSLVGSLKPIDFYSCFISYSNKDRDFVEQLFADLQAKKVRCWFAPEQMKIGDRIRPRLSEAIQIHDKFLLVLSEVSVVSEWVEYEVEKALARERKEKRTILFPIRIDDAVLESSTAWAEHIQNTRHIGDFTCWKDRYAYEKAVDRLLRDLKAEEQKGMPREDRS